VLFQQHGWRPVAVRASEGPSEGLFAVKGTRLGIDSGSNNPE